MAFTLIIAWLILLLLAALVGGSLLNLSSSPHWFVRGWDFPRVQILALAWMLTGIYWLLWVLGPTDLPPAWISLAIAVGLTLWHGFRILPYTPLLPKQSVVTPAHLCRSPKRDERTLRTVMTNVEMENDQFDVWMDVMRQADPDILLVVEVDQRWIDAVQPLIESYPHQVIEPRDNWYGMMLLSRLPIVTYEVLHLVQKDIPSIDAKIRLDDGTLMRFVGVHPRPPEPVRDNDAKPRDAELTLWGEELAEDDGPVIIGGDLNDVAWSATTRLFLRVSGLLDPRRGRGFYNTFHADHWYMRFPLDHIFHSAHFTISKLQRLPFVGSDHFPMLIDLRYTPSQSDEQDVLETKQADDEEAEVRIERAIEDEDLDGEAVDEGKRESIKDVKTG
ncbi:endonuclease/exonuclease/phosphatase family protein [Roseimaritima sediminicola]|uniref:endonuclease/exonuclease/phosphatase family protein n=1 Tax=Roseimaritima sediminicola TaxID=2662066 RepID=UPI0012982D62|nr:endonuclease/exonuclease/phosphatase family protein [Roseimaritima sediminicola]